MWIREGFFPHLTNVVLDRVQVGGDNVLIHVRTVGTAAVCPICQTVATRLHSRYVRCLADAAIVSRPLRLLVKVRKFFCDNASCLRKVFCERLEFADRYARRTRLAYGGLMSVALALGGRAGARLAAVLGLASSPTTLLRVIRRIPDGEAATPRCSGSTISLPAAGAGTARSPCREFRQTDGSSAGTHGSVAVGQHGRTRGFARTDDSVVFCLGLEDLLGGRSVADRGLITETEHSGQV